MASGLQTCLRRCHQHLELTQNQRKTDIWCKTDIKISCLFEGKDGGVVEPGGRGWTWRRELPAAQHNQQPPSSKASDNINPLIWACDCFSRLQHHLSWHLSLLLSIIVNWGNYFQEWPLAWHSLAGTWSKGRSTPMGEQRSMTARPLLPSERAVVP